MLPRFPPVRKNEDGEADKRAPHLSALHLKLLLHVRKYQAKDPLHKSKYPTTPAFEVSDASESP